MRSRFQTFFILMKLFLVIVTVVFIGIPVYLLVYSFFHPENIFPALLATFVFGVFAYLLVKDHKVITVELNETSMRFNSMFGSQTLLYTYSDIERINIEVHREESYSKYGKLVNVNYDPMATIHFKDGNAFTLYDDTYANVQEMLDFIELKRNGV